jgi:hypothetical protein
VSIQEEIHIALKEIQKKVNEGSELNSREIQTLLLTSLIEDEG